MHVRTSDGEDIETTMFHPFYVRHFDKESGGSRYDGEWKAASSPLAGDVLQKIDGSTVYVTEVTVEKFPESINVYNLEIQDLHTYYVADRVLVHNQCEIDKKKVKEDSENHIFSDKHVRGEIMELGTDRDSIMDEALKIVEDVDSKNNLGDGPLQIRTHINNLQVEIRIFIRDGKLINFDMFKGWSVEIKRNSIEW